MINYWWVNQHQTFVEDVKEKNPGIVADVTTDVNGNRLDHHDRVMEMRPEDRIISNIEGKVVAIGQVVSNPEIVEKHYWKVSNAIGPAYVVEVKYELLNPPIRSKIFREKILCLNIPGSPIVSDSNGRPYHRTGYVFCFSKDGFDIIKKSQPETNWPDWA